MMAVLGAGSQAPVGREWERHRLCCPGTGLALKCLFCGGSSWRQQVTGLTVPVLAQRVGRVWNLPSLGQDSNSQKLEGSPWK